MGKLFSDADVIHVYTREQATRDRVLVDVTACADSDDAGHLVRGKPISHSERSRSPGPCDGEHRPGRSVATLVGFSSTMAVRRSSSIGSTSSSPRPPGPLEIALGEFDASTELWQRLTLPTALAAQRDQALAALAADRVAALALVRR